MEPTLNSARLTRTALLLALTLLFQSLRLIIPLPVFMSTFLIGSLVNACLLISLQTVGVFPAIVIAVIAPVVAYFQQLLPIPVFILPVALGNSLYVLLFRAGMQWGKWLGIGLAALGKSVFMYIVFAWMLTLIELPGKLAAGLMFVMSWPQLVTTIAGGILAGEAFRRIKNI